MDFFRSLGVGFCCSAPLKFNTFTWMCVCARMCVCACAWVCVCVRARMLEREGENVCDICFFVTVGLFSVTWLPRRNLIGWSEHKKTWNLLEAAHADMQHSLRGPAPHPPDQESSKFPSLPGKFHFHWSGVHSCACCCDGAALWRIPGLTRYY